MAHESPPELPFDDELPIDQIDEELVAYLDGELEDAAREKLEQQLLANPELRQRLSQLQSGWEMLDHLPSVSVTADFARTTIEMIAASESQSLATQGSPFPKKKILWILALGVCTLVCAFTGYAIPLSLNAARFQSQVADLPIAEHLNAYLADIDLTLIVQLSSDDIWQSSIGLAQDAGNIQALPEIQLVASDRDSLLEALDPIDRKTKLLLSTNWDRFSAYDEVKKNKLRQRALEVQQSENPERTLETLDQYAQWFNQLWPEAQDSLLKAKPEDKLALIRELVQQNARRWLRDYGSSIGEVDRELIYERLKLIARDRLSAAEAKLSELSVDARKKVNTTFIRQDPEALIQGLPNAWNWIRFRNNRNDDRRGPDTDEGRIFATLYGLLTDDELLAVEEILSKRSLMVLNSQTDNRDSRAFVLQGWCTEIIQQMTPRADSPEKMLERYRNTPPEFRQILDLRNPEDILDTLRGQRDPRRSR